MSINVVNGGLLCSQTTFGWLQIPITTHGVAPMTLWPDYRDKTKFMDIEVFFKEVLLLTDC